LEVRGARKTGERGERPTGEEQQGRAVFVIQRRTRAPQIVTKTVDRKKGSRGGARGKWRGGVEKHPFTKAKGDYQKLNQGDIYPG